MLKWVALVLMLLDHLGEFFPQSVPLWFRWLGRMSAPLFLFCLAQGLEKTRSRPRYLKRLWTGSAVMGLGSFALTLLFPQAPVAISNNIFSTMAVIACIVWIYESFDGASPRRDNLKNPEAALAFFVAGQVLIVLVSILAQRGGVIWVRLINALLPNLVLRGQFGRGDSGAAALLHPEKSPVAERGLPVLLRPAAVQLADRGAGGWKLELALAACLPVDDGRFAAADALL